jgi:GNAT superfamily N-acetyltransferase
MTPPAPRIRPARPADHAAVEALQWRASCANPGDRAALLAQPDAVSTPPSQLVDGHVFVAEAGPTLLGFAAAIPRPDGDFELDALFVDPDLWRAGIGRRLLAACILHARTHGAQALHVIGNPHARGFYDSTGFERTGTTETRFGPAALMVLRLPQTPGPIQPLGAAA